MERHLLSLCSMFLSFRADAHACSSREQERGISTVIHARQVIECVGIPHARRSE